MLLYRLRDIGAVLDSYHELNDQTLYFAAPDELNDPMEGFTNFFWDGDRIAWENLLRHFVVGLSDTLMDKFLGGEITSPEYHVSTALVSRFYKSQAHKELYENLTSTFLKKEEAKSFLRYIERKKRKISQQELLMHLFLMNTPAFETIIDLFAEKKLMDGRIVSGIPRSDSCTRFFSLISEKEDSEIPANFISQMSIVTSQINDALSFHRVKQLSEDQYTYYDDMHFLLMGYPGKFLIDLQQSIYPEWYAACFMGNCNRCSPIVNKGAVFLGFKASEN